jgi:hypothetical protein
MKMKLPAKFYLDHRARDCGQSGKIVRSTQNYVIVELDAIALDDLLSDADYYASLRENDFQENKGVCLSARATVKAINNQLTEENK